MSRRRATLRFAIILVGLFVVVCGLLSLHPRVQYVIGAATVQLDLLWGRVPVEDAIAAGHYTPAQAERLRQIPAIKQHAKKIGLADTGHYTTINPDWDETIWNVSACEELSFTPRTWWFPIVGTVPYLGYFDEAEAREEAAGLEAEELDVYVRTAGAWSTLGWFEDPVLPKMMTWPETRLADTLHHELTHATVWIPGSVAFNESLANYVGREAGLAFIIEKYGEDHAIVQKEIAYRADRQVYMDLMRQVYEDLDAVYSDDALTDVQKRSKKQAILSGLSDRAAQAPFKDAARWQVWFEKDPWNNARLVQFRVYNRSPAWFDEIRRQEGGNIGAFLTRIEAIAAGSSDPYRALAEAAGVDPSTLGDEPVR
ncbi:MAG: aminopeptidase [Myxococcota bacterium]